MQNGSVKARDIVKRSTEVRRLQQYNVLKTWDLGRITANQCIEGILDLEKVIYVGDNFRTPQLDEAKQ